MYYDESKIDWAVFGRDQRIGRGIVGYQAFGMIETGRHLMGLSQDEVACRWKQLMYFFATIFVLARAGSFLPGNKPLQPPPNLEELWRLFRQVMPDHFEDFCRAFFSGQDIGWRQEYPEEHRLDQDRLHLILQTAELIEFEIDLELWAL